MNRSITAGIFYPENPASLEEEIRKNFLDYEEQIRLPAALFIPHAAYEYILPIMAKGFAPFTRSTPERVIILAPIHNEILKEDSPKTIFLPSFDRITTPLGDIPVDQDLCEQLDGTHQLIGYGDHYFDEETAVELAVPPIQQFFGDAVILPILIGETTAKTASTLASIITPLIDDRTLVLISANMTGWEKKEDLGKQAATMTSLLERVSEGTRPALLEAYRSKEITSCGTVLFEALHRTGRCRGPWQIPETDQPKIEALIEDSRSTIFMTGYLPLESNT